MPLQNNEVGKLVNKVGFEIDNKSWANLKKFNEKIKETKDLMKGLKGSVKLNAKVSETKKYFRSMQDAHVKAREAAVKKEQKMYEKFRDATSKEKLRDIKREQRERNKVENTIGSRMVRSRTVSEGLTKLKPEQKREFARLQAKLNDQLRKGAIDISNYRAKSEQLSTTYKRLNNQTRNLNQRFSSLRHNLIAGGIAYAGFQTAMGGEGFGQQFESLESTLFGATGSELEAMKELEFLKKTTQEWGVNTLDVAKGYTQILTVSQSTSLSMQEIHDLFTATTKAAAAFGMTASQSEGAIKAFVQIH